MTKLIVIGAGIGGLAAAAEAARHGYDVTLLEKSDQPGGKMRHQVVEGARIDAGPTVLTMKPVFEDLFARHGRVFADDVPHEKLDILARHFWPDGTRLDLFADRAQSYDAIARFAGRKEADGFASFADEAARLYYLLQDKFIFSERKGSAGMIAALGFSGLAALFQLGPFATLWTSLGRHFKDERLRQLFARYATYSGGSPFLSPATLMLIADVEMQGVYHLAGGMASLAQAMAALVEGQGGTIRYGAAVSRFIINGGRISGVTLANGETLNADRVIFNGDVAALADGLFGENARGAGLPMPPQRRSLSAVTWCGYPNWCGDELVHHNVFFDRDYRSEFDDVFRKRQLPTNPTLYLCAQDRGNQAQRVERERIFMLVNAPADGERRMEGDQIEAVEAKIAQHLSRIGVCADLTSFARTTPYEFNQYFPATGGALYGAAPHGWIRSVSRGTARTAIEGLYRCGGSVHPGAGVPLATLSGLKAVSAMIADGASINLSRRTVISGGMSTPSAQMDATG